MAASSFLSSAVAVDPSPSSRVQQDTLQTRLTFTLPRAATTSAGVYDAQGRLVRTLWRAEALRAGEHQRAWDQRDDSGRVVTGGEHEIQLIHHTVRYAWEGVIGNSSSARGGPTVHKAFLPPTSLMVQGDRMIYAVGYNEGQPGLHGFSLSAPQRDTRPLPSTDAFVSYSMIAADAKRLYWANTGGLSRSSFVGAFELATGRPAAFSAGRSVCLNMRANSTQCYEDQDYPSVIDLRTDAVEAPTGLAVQRNGRVLAVAHGGQNLIRLYDKISGALLREMSVVLNPKALNQLAMSATGDLWVISGTSVLRYTELEHAPAVAATIRGLAQPLALGLGPSNDDEVWVADGGSSQQLKRHDRNGRLQDAIGRIDGYGSDPTVAADKLCFRTPDGRGQAALAVTADGTVWVVDHCNNRMLRFRTSGAGAGRSDQQIAYLPHVYASTVDHGQPKRVFANFLEFEVDSAAPLAPGDGSWRLVRNWLAGLPPALVDERADNRGFGGFVTVETLSNGRTYGVVNAQGRPAIVELPASGPLRVVKLLSRPLPNTTSKVMYENGDLGYALTGPSTQSVMRLPLAGFDSGGNPLWSNEPITAARVPTLPGSPYFRGAFSGSLPPRFPLTGSGRVIFFDQSVKGNEGFHLGAVEAGGSDWLWRASPTGPLDSKGSFQTSAIDGSMSYGGNAVWTQGRHIVYGYHGEFYKDLGNGRVGQANQFMHFDQSGLFIGQFGQASTLTSDASQSGLSGNAFSPTLVRDGSHLYLYHNDESSHGGVHRWRLDGWDDVVELRGRGPTGGTIMLR